MRKLNLICLFFSSLVLLQTYKVQASVEEVRIYFTPNLCQTSCERGLERQIRNIRGVKNIEIRGMAGEAHLGWQSNVPFSFRSLEAAMAMIGLSNDRIYVRVKGSIKQEGRNILLISTGDQTTFYLMSAPNANPNIHVEKNSPFNRQLQPQVQAQLLEAEKNRQEVTIGGELFQPETSPPLFLTIETITLH